MIKAVLFDLDGTLADTLTALANTANIVLQKAGLPTHPIDAYRLFVGNGAKLLMQRAAGKEDDTLHRAFLAEYDRCCLEDTPPYEGVLQTLDYLKSKGLHLAVITNKPHEQAQKLVWHLFGDRFEAIYGSKDDYPRKPDPHCCYEVMSAFGVKTEECVFVGDSAVDVQTAHAAGMPCIGCVYGFRGKDELTSAGADALVYSFSELQKNRLIFA